MRRQRTPVLACLIGALTLSFLAPSVSFAQYNPLVVAQQGQPVVPPPLSPGVSPAEAPRRGPVRRPVEIRMMVIHASNAFTGYDRGIIQLKRHLSFLNYRGFRLLFQNEMMLRPGTTRRLGLFEGNTIEVTLDSATWERAVLHVRMSNPSRPAGAFLDTVVSVTRRGTFFVGGPRYNGGVLILPITAWY